MKVLVQVLPQTRSSLLLEQEAGAWRDLRLLLESTAVTYPRETDRRRVPVYKFAK